MTHVGPTSCYSSFILTFYSHLSCMDLDMNLQVWCRRPQWTLWCEENRSRYFIYIFNYFMKIWRMQKKVFPCAALSGCFLARLIVTWIHFLVNELQECDSIDSICLRLVSFFANYLFRINWWCRNRLGLGANSWPGPNYACHWIYMCSLRD